MVFEIRNKVDKRIDEVYENAIKEFGEFFGFRWEYNKPKVFFVPDRKIIDILYGRKTEDWLIAWANGRDIYMLEFEKLETESSHKNRTWGSFCMTLRHELAHSFSSSIAKYSHIPSWLSEGISMYLSKQVKYSEKPESFENFIKFYKHNKGDGVYRESGFAVKFLIESYGKEKLLELLEKNSEAKNEEEFGELFKSVYGFELKYENFKLI